MTKGLAWSNFLKVDFPKTEVLENPYDVQLSGDRAKAYITLLYLFLQI